MTPAETAVALGACADGRAWAGGVGDMGDVWDRLDRGEFILWYWKRKRLRHDAALQTFARECVRRYLPLIRDPILRACAIDPEAVAASPIKAAALERMRELLLPDQFSVDDIIGFAPRQLRAYLLAVAEGTAGRAAAGLLKKPLTAAIVAGRDVSMAAAAVELLRHVDNLSTVPADRTAQLNATAAQAVAAEQAWQAHRLKQLLPNPF